MTTSNEFAKSFWTYNEVSRKATRCDGDFIFRVTFTKNLEKKDKDWLEEIRKIHKNVLGQLKAQLFRYESDHFDTVFTDCGYDAWL